MKIFKFGGASVNDAKAIKNAVKIVQDFNDDEIIVVVSAMGKTTNALEALVNDFYYSEGDPKEKLEAIKKYHFSILDELFPAKDNPVFEEIHNLFVEIEWQIEDLPVGTFDFEYDQMVAMGELLSSKIVAAYLNFSGLNSKWLDARDVIRTDNSYRKALVDWKVTQELMDRKVKPIFENSDEKRIVTQGFIASTSENFNTTLGREGSDFSTAIFAFCLDAAEVIIWKDVEGMLNADPKFYQNTVKLNEISYLEAVELAYFGASVIHPKTIKPLQNKNIPLKIKSFINPLNKGTLITKNTASDSLIPSFIHKENQFLISIAAIDFDFIMETHLSYIYNLFSEHTVSINLMQNSAISFSVCVDYDKKKLKHLLDELKKGFKITFNENLTLITIRHYTDELLHELIEDRKVLLEQKTRNTARFVVQ